jgi:hypothetical protein
MGEARQAFEELEAFVATYDPISLLSQLTLTFLFVPEDEFQGEASDVDTWQRRIEFLAGYLLVRPYPSGRTGIVDGQVLARAQKLADQYFATITQQLLAEGAKAAETSEEQRLLEQAKIVSFYVRGDAYPHQFYAFAQDLYGAHDVWFRAHYGFNIAEGINLAQAISRLCGEHFSRSLRQAREEARRQTDELIASREVGETARGNVESRIGCTLHFGNSERVLGFTLDELSLCSGMSVRTCGAFLKRMSQEFGYRNAEFPNSFIDPAAAPWDYNTLHERPIVTRADRYWLYVPPLLRSALFSTFYFDLMKDNAYRPTFEKARGKFLESKTADCLRRVFPAGAVALNPCYPKGEEMADVMVLHDRKVLLFQCKTKTLTYPARVGADFKALKTDVKKAIADAFEQGIRASDYLRASNEPEFVVGEEVSAIDMGQVNGLYLVAITAMPFQTLNARLANTNAALGLFSGNEYPWSLSLGDLDILTQVLGSPAEFLHYLLRRRQVEWTAFAIHADEMDYLGFYLSQGLCFEADQFQGLDLVGLSGMSNDIDRWVYEKFELGRDVRPPRTLMPTGFSDFLKDIERTGDDCRTDCAIALLDHSGPARKRFMEMVAQTKGRSRQDKAFHSFSAVMKGGKRGVSFVSFDANADRTQVFKQAAALAMLKKYETKCDEWAGFGWDLASLGAVDVAFFAYHAWAYDERMEQLVRDKLRPGQRIDP